MIVVSRTGSTKASSPARMVNQAAEVARQAQYQERRQRGHRFLKNRLQLERLAVSTAAPRLSAGSSRELRGERQREHQRASGRAPLLSWDVTTWSR